MTEKSEKKVKKTPIAITIDHSSDGWKIFNSFLQEDSKFGLTEKELIDYAVNELKIPRNTISEELEEYLPSILVVYMNTWSGWLYKKNFLDGGFTKELYFERFQKYMMLKMSHVIKGGFLLALKAVEQDLGYGVGKMAGQSKFSPYAISIGCPPQMLNTLVFCNSGDDIILKQHLGTPMVILTTTQLLNWPHIEVTFRTADICIVRRQATEFFRYLNLMTIESTNFNAEENIIEQAELLLANGKDRVCYSNDFIETYINVYLKTLKQLPQIPTCKFEEIQTILNQFHEDVKYINVNNSMATNTRVLFRLSQAPFIRNKKLVKKNEKPSREERVGYCEIITPKIELTLSFQAKQVKTETTDIRFEFTDKLMDVEENESASSVLPQIAYKCTFCKVEFSQVHAKHSMLEHLKKEHKMEQYMRCTVCKKQFDVLNLAACRWRHKCQSPASTSSSDLIVLS